MRKVTQIRAIAVALTLLAVIPIPAARAQTAEVKTTAPVEPTLQDSVHELAGEIKELSSTIQELRAEVQRSRQETRELRTELDGAMDRLSALSPAAPLEDKKLSTPQQAQVIAPAPPAAPVAAETDARLNQLEEDQQLLQSKIDEQHQTKVESESKYRVKLGGIALFNLFGNSGTVDNLDVPNVALPRPAGGPSGSVGATLRQSELGLEAYGPTLWGAQISGDVNIDFMGGFSDAPNGVTDNIVRLRTATMRMDWAHTSVVAGQDNLFFSPLSPTSFASLGYPSFADAGNLWTWTPQLRVERRMDLSESNRLVLQGGLLDPLSGEVPYSQYYRTPGPGEQSRTPALASRAAWTRGQGDHAFTVGVGGYFSRQRYGPGENVDAWAATVDWNAPLTHRFFLSGEFYRGTALGGLGAAEGTSVLVSNYEATPPTGFSGLDTIGGWAQLKFKATQTLEFNAAMGEDNPFARELQGYSEPYSYGYAPMQRNQNAFFNAIFRPRSDLVFALEYRYINSLEASDSKNTAGTLNLSMGVLF
jgi:hypothetical protein